jgi:hypothetical protein
MPLSTAEIKRQILLQSDDSGIRKEMVKRHVGRDEDMIIEWADALEQMVKLKGWSILEGFLIREMDIPGMYADNANERKIGYGKAMMTVMQFVDQTIKAKAEILKRQEEARKNSPKGQESEGE